MQISYQGAQQLGSGAQVLPLQHGEPPVPEHERHRRRRSTTCGCARRSRWRSTGRRSPQGLWGKYAQVGNDSPMWPGYAVHGQVGPAAQAGSRQGEGAAQGRGNATNLKLTLTCYRSFEMPDYAQRVASRPEEDRHHLHRQGLHERAVLRRRLLRRRRQARAVALDGLRHRRLRRTGRCR